ncbi:LOB domain-containing protein 40-like [Malania oleifera]|uniref:LOB domain-containing protein 40-like n=1 Tax=Malania oleifera TaxID=397392 RepID=UPI0025AE4677|nr:LOB domain-containing protein 40-like [Malania oleifera]
MRMSCNGCRVLRKGCSESCTIRPCLLWIKSPDSQANATVFLAKFYGRAGLLNLINAGPPHLRPSIFRSLLYEACGRIVNPVYGSAGLLWSGNWHLCQAAVEAVLSGAPIMAASSDSAACDGSPPFKACDIRHVSKSEAAAAAAAAAASQEFTRVRTRTRFKRSAGKLNKQPAAELVAESTRMEELNVSGSLGSGGGDSDSVSVETVEAALAKPDQDRRDGSDVELELTLGLDGGARAQKGGRLGMKGGVDATCRVGMGLHLTA